MSSHLVSDSIFWVEVEKILPNPYQPRREFDEAELRALADSIQQYGVLQPLVVTRRETPKDDGGIEVQYELIAGERRLRASKLAGLSQVPVVIRTGEDDNKMKLELAIIENLQREDLNPVERARAFQQFVDEFGYKHSDIAKKVGKSREYVSNSLRLLSLPGEVLDALIAGKISEGHARPIMMLKGKPQEQLTLFKEIVHKKLTVRDAESIARRSARDKIRKKTREFDPRIIQLEKDLTEQFGTRVHIEPREVGGKITIDFFSDDDLKNILTLMNNAEYEEEKNNEQNAQNDSGSTPLYPDEDPAPSELHQEQKQEAQHSDTPKQHDIGKMINSQSAGDDNVSTVAFGGSKQKKEIPDNPLGEVLRSVLKKEQQEEDTGTESEPGQEHNTNTHDRVAEKYSAQDAHPQETHAAEEHAFDAHDFDGPTTEEAPKETSVVENTTEDDFELPDMSSFKTEVSSLLHTDIDTDQNDEESNDPYSSSIESADQTEEKPSSEGWYR